MKHQNEKLNPDEQQIEEEIRKNLAHLYNYPSIGKLFSTNDLSNLGGMRIKLNSTRERLDTIVRRGTNEEAEKASRALKAVSITLEFLQNLEDEKKINQ